MNQRGFVKSYIVALLLFSMIVTGFWLIPQEDGGFWQSYGYSATGDLNQFDVSSNVSKNIADLGCDINPESGTCADKKSNIFTTGTNFISGIVQGAFGGLVSIYKSFGITRVLIENIGDVVGVPPIVINTIISIILFVLLFTILLIIFNRSDSG